MDYTQYGASSGDSKKRRSFLPAPKKSGASPTSPQQSFPAPPLQQQQQQQQHQQASHLQYHPQEASHHQYHQQQQQKQSYHSLTSSTTSSSVDFSRESSRSKSADSGHKKSGGAQPPRHDEGQAPDFGKGLRVGARVKIGGVKLGVLRYLGTTHLAPGIFCGIELFDSDGCHDGEVNGHRYFNCPPKHGIFAPKDKVCLDPTAEPLTRVASDSEGTYSSSESLTERSYKAFKDFEEPEIEAIDYSTLSPESSFHEALQRGDEAAKRHYRNLRAYAKAKLSGVGVASPDKSPENPEYSLHASSYDSFKRGRSGLPKASTSRTSNLPAPSSASYTKLPTFSRSYQKVDEPEVLSASHSKQLHYAALPCDPQIQYRPPLDARGLDATVTYAHHESASPRSADLEPAPFQRFRAIANARSSDDSEEDAAFPRDATLSTGIKKQLRGDSRQYLNFTFDQEEQNRSLDDSGSSDSTGRDRAASGLKQPFYNAANPVYSEPRFLQRPASGSECSEESIGSLSPATLSNNALAAADEVEAWRREAESRCRTSTPVYGRSGRGGPGSGPIQSASYTLVTREEHARAALDSSRSESDLGEDEGEGRRHHVVMETTRSISDSDLPVELLPSSEECDDRAGSQTFPQVGALREADVVGADQRGQRAHMEGGYAGERSSGGGDAVGLTLSPSLDSGKSESSLAHGHEAEAAAQSRSYTICSAEEGDPHLPLPPSHHQHSVTAEAVDGGSSRLAADGGVAVVGSASYTIARSSTDSVTCSPARIARKISSGSSCETNNGGDSSSSGADPRTESSEGGGSSGKGDNMDDSSSGPSPEVSQALEWDYGQDFDGKLPLGRHDSTVMTTSASTGTSDSLSDVLPDMSETSDGGGTDGEPASANGSIMDDSDSQFETPDNDFENIDSLEDFPIFGKDAKTIMTDSGISDKDFESSSAKSTCSTVCGNSSDDCSREDDMSSHRTPRAISSDSSQETLGLAGTPGSVEEKDLPYDHDDDSFPCPATSTSALDVDAMDMLRSRKDSFEEGNASASPASVVSVEDVDSSLHEKTIMAELSSHQARVVVHASGVRHRGDEDHATEAPPAATTATVTTKTTRPESGIEDSEVESGSLPGSANSLEDVTLGLNDDDQTCTEGRKERPVSLLSTTSVDTGYVPDSESDLGTLTTNSPCDIVDRIGLEHQPLDEFTDPHDDPDFGMQDVQQVAGETGKDAEPAASLSLKCREDDDVSVDLTSQTEDDRIEADQVNGPRADDLSSDGVKVGEGGSEQNKAVPADTTPGSGVDAQKPVDSTSPSSVPGGGTAATTTTSGKAGSKKPGGESKEGSTEPTDQEKAKPAAANKKQFKMTKKKMDVIDHKLPNTTKVTSRLADYIKASPPPSTKVKDEEEQKKISSTTAKKKANNAANNTGNINNKTASSNSNKNKKKSSVSEAGGGSNTTTTTSNNNKSSRGPSTDREVVEAKVPEKAKPPVIKRTPPKSKWGDIMSQIGASKDNPKPKSEVKSSLASYLSAPTPAPPAPAPILGPTPGSIPINAGQQVAPFCSEPSSVASDDLSVSANNTRNVADQDVKKVAPRREPKPSRIKPLPPPPPKIDLSKVKSKLNVPTAASASKVLPKRDSSPSNAKNKRVSSLGKTPRDSSPSTQAAREGHIVLVRQPLSGVSSVRSSRTDLSLAATTEDGVGEEGVSSKRGSVDLTKKGRRLSTRSETAEKVKQNKELSRRHSEIKTSKQTNPSPCAKPGHRVTADVRQQAGQERRAPSLSPQRTTSTSSNTSSQPVILKPVKPKPAASRAAANCGSASSSPARTTIVISARQAWGPSGKPNTVTIKGRDSAGNPGHKRPVSKVANGSSRSNGVVPASAAPLGPKAGQKEIQRLGSLCEARTKELTQTKMQLRATSQAFDAMAVVVNYCCAELNAFECPELAQKLDKVQKQLTGCLSHIADLTSQKETLSHELSQELQLRTQAHQAAEEASLRAEGQLEEHHRAQRDLEDTHNAALTTQRDELTAKHTDTVKKLHECHDKEIDLQKNSFDRQIQDVQNEHKMEVNNIRISHLEEIQELRNKHDKQMEELHKQHRNKLEDITHRFESIKLTLSEKVESLRGECDDLRHRARSSEDALQRDADVKVQMALAPYLALPKEIESLRTIMEMKTEETQKLRSKMVDLEKQLEELPIAKDKIISLQQKIENLEAIISIKTDHEKQMHEKCQLLMRKYDRESRANQRLSMEFEQVVWRMSQSQEFGSSESLTKRQVSRSPPHSETTSPDPRRRCLSPGSGGDVVLRRKKRSSHSVGEADMQCKLRSRSATFVLEKHEKMDGVGGEESSRSCTSSPQFKQRRPRTSRLSQGGDDDLGGGSSELLSSGDYNNGVVADDTRDRARLCSELIADKSVEGDTTVITTFNSQADPLASTDEMINSYARSISGVSDSGVYDSLTRSEMLNSSLISTDSEWLASANVSMTLDPEELSSMQGSSSDRTVFTDRAHICPDSSLSGKVVPHAPPDVSQHSLQHHPGLTGHSYEFQVSLPGSSAGDDVFEDHEDPEDLLSLDSATFSIDNNTSTTEGGGTTNDSRLTSVSEDFCVCEDKDGEGESSLTVS